MGVSKILPPDDLEPIKLIIHRADHTGEPFEIEHLLEHYRGEYRWKRDNRWPYPNLDPDIDFVIYTDAGFESYGQEQTKKEIRRQNARLRILYDISRAFTETNFAQHSILSTLEVIVRLCAELIGDTCIISLLSDDGDWLEPVAFFSMYSEVSACLKQVLPSIRFKLGRDLGACVASEKQPLLIPQISQDKIFKVIGQEYRSSMKRFGTPTWLIVPICTHGEIIGTLGLARAKPGQPYQQEDYILLYDLAERIALEIKNVRLYEETKKRSTDLARSNALSQRLVQVQEAERRQIARELHDAIGQILTGLSLMLKTVTTLSLEEQKVRLREASSMVNDLMKVVREQSLNLRPSMLDDLGLLPTLLWHFERFSAHTGVQVFFQHNGIAETRFPGDIETAMYRIVQEALTNVARHANVKAVEVIVRANNGSLRLGVIDKGKGFNIGALETQVSCGLTGMRERASLLGGSFEVKSNPGQGTELEATIPLNGQ